MTGHPLKPHTGVNTAFPIPSLLLKTAKTIRLFFTTEKEIASGYRCNA